MEFRRYYGYRNGAEYFAYDDGRLRAHQAALNFEKTDYAVFNRNDAFRQRLCSRIPRRAKARLNGIEVGGYFGYGRQRVLSDYHDAVL